MYKKLTGIISESILDEMVAQPKLIHDHMECIIFDGWRVPLEMILNLRKEKPTKQKKKKKEKGVLVSYRFRSLFWIDGEH